MCVFVCILCEHRFVVCHVFVLATIFPRSVSPAFKKWKSKRRLYRKSMYCFLAYRCSMAPPKQRKREFFLLLLSSCRWLLRRLHRHCRRRYSFFAWLIFHLMFYRNGSASRDRIFSSFRAHFQCFIRWCVRSLRTFSLATLSRLSHESHEMSCCFFAFCLWIILLYADEAERRAHNFFPPVSRSRFASSCYLSSFESKINCRVEKFSASTHKENAIFSLLSLSLCRRIVLSLCRHSSAIWMWNFVKNLLAMTLNRLIFVASVETG